VPGPGQAAPGGSGAGDAPPLGTPPLGPPPLTAIEALGLIAPVTQALPPRLALVDVALADAAEILAQPYTVGVYAGPPPAGVLATLDLAERIFVDAWLARVQLALGGAGPPPGDGLPWDAPGYEPPDPPGSAAEAN
jgi:hypothetical protein